MSALEISGTRIRPLVMSLAKWRPGSRGGGGGWGRRIKSCDFFLNDCQGRTAGDEQPFVHLLMCCLVPVSGAKSVVSYAFAEKAY